MTIALTKTLDPERDYPELALELVIVDRYFQSATPQHEHRRFEYALALRAATTWAAQRPAQSAVISYDIGGAGSPFSQMAGAVLHETCCRIDPAENWTLEQYLQTDPPVRHAVFCLSVIEHVDDLDRFLYHLSCLVAPGGLLFLTMDAWDQGPVDTAHFHWMRKRIFNTAIRYDSTCLPTVSLCDWKGVYQAFSARAYLTHDFTLFGEPDWTYHGAQLYGSYTFASLALIKRP